MGLCRGQQPMRAVVWAAFADSGNVASYAREDIAALLRLSLIQGNDGQLQPFKSTSRAQAAVLIHRRFELL
jgi:hypothetical protein